MESKKSGEFEAGICYSFPKKRKIDWPNNQFMKKGLLLPHKCGECLINKLFLNRTKL
jgi:hypothetical protein